MTCSTYPKKACFNSSGVPFKSSSPPDESWQVPVRHMGISRTIFDSFRSPLAAGLRSLSLRPRQIAYQHQSTVIDVSIEVLQGSGLISLTGQVLDAERKDKNDGLSVLLVDGMAILARTATNQFDEFNLQFESAEDVNLEILLGDRSSA